MFKIVGTTIKVTRGDSGTVPIIAMNEDKTEYMFKAEEVVRFKVFEAKKCDSVILQKELKIKTPTTKAEIELTKDDTKIGELISKPTTYWYEVELNPETNPQTIICYDDVDGPKLFILYPEGGDKK